MLWPLIDIFTSLSAEAMMYFASRRMRLAATFGANQPFNLIVAISLFPIMVSLLVSTYFVASVLPSITVSTPVRSRAGLAAVAAALAAKGGAIAGSTGVGFSTSIGAADLRSAAALLSSKCKKWIPTRMS